VGIVLAFVGTGFDDGTNIQSFNAENHAEAVIPILCHSQRLIA
jgi:hypothetical protein